MAVRARYPSTEEPTTTMSLLSDPFTAAPQVSAVNLLDPTSLLSWAGAAAVLVVLLLLFAETGRMIGLLLLGDSPLFTAGQFRSTTARAGIAGPSGWVLPAAGAGTPADAQHGCLIGRRAGPALLGWGRLRPAAGMRREHELLDRYGDGKAIVAAWSIPVVRTVLNPWPG